MTTRRRNRRDTLMSAEDKVNDAIGCASDLWPCGTRILAGLLVTTVVAWLGVRRVRNR